MKKLFSVLLIAALLLILTACPPSFSPEHAFAFVQCYGADAYANQLLDGFADAVVQWGGSATWMTPADSTAKAQETLIRSLIEDGIKGIAINANEATGLETVLKEAKEAGIPVITVGRDTAGSQLLVQPGSPETMGKSLMDAMYDMTGGEGSFVVISGTSSISGQDQWVSGMQLAAQDSKYKDVHWVETNYAGHLDYSEYNMDEIKELLNVILDKYPDLEVICYVGGSDLPLCIQALEEMGSEIRVTGMGQPSQMENLVGKDRTCPFYFMWDPAAVGKCAAYALDALADGATMHQDAALATQLGEFALYSGFAAEFYIYAAPPFRFEGLPTDPNY